MAIEVCMLVSEYVVSFDTIYLKLTCIERKVVLMNKYKNTSWVLEETLENRETEIHGSRNKMFLKNYKFTKDLKSLGKIFYSVLRFKQNGKTHGNAVCFI